MCTSPTCVLPHDTIAQACSIPQSPLFHKPAYVHDKKLLVSVDIKIHTVQSYTFFVTLTFQIYIPNQNTDTKCQDSKNDKCNKRTSWVKT